jgi:hypothetical protein
LSEVFVSGVVVDERDGAMRTREGVVIVFIILGIGKIYLGGFSMVREDLLFVGDKVPSLFGIACDGTAGYREFQPQIHLDGGIDEGVEAEDLLLAIWVLGVTANADPGIHVGGEFRAAKKE